MNLLEYKKIEKFSYYEYCQYLQKKYGIGNYDYMTKNYNKNPKSSRTNEGLIAHHRYEDTVIMLSDKEYAMKYPIEWQSKENLIYCDYLEHLLLHVLICENPSKDKELFMNVGIGGVINFLVPELNDLYSGWKTKQKWRENCHALVINDKEAYLAILKKFIDNSYLMLSLSKDSLCKSYNEQFGLWDKSQNKNIYLEIKKLIEGTFGDVSRCHNLEEDEIFFTMNDLMARYNVSRPTIHKTFFGNGMPSEKIKNKLVVKKSLLIEWELQQRSVPYKQKSKIILPAWEEKKKILLKQLKEAKKNEDKELICYIRTEMKKYKIYSLDVTEICSVLLLSTLLIISLFWIMINIML